MNLPFEEFLYRRTVEQGWIIIFADLLALMLTFFVLIFSMNAVQYEDWESVVASLSDKLNPSRATVSEKAWEGREATMVYKPFAISLDYLNAVLEQKISHEEALSGIIVHRPEGRLVISVPVVKLFESREIKLSRNGTLMLGELSLLMRQLTNRVGVIGHTDVSQPSGRFFASNWDLSLNRALTVAGGLAEAGYSGPLTAIGYGDSRFRDLDTSIELSERYVLAQRIDLIVYEKRRDDADDIGQ